MCWCEWGWMSESILSVFLSVLVCVCVSVIACHLYLCWDFENRNWYPMTIFLYRITKYKINRRVRGEKEDPTVQCCDSNSFVYQRVDSFHGNGLHWSCVLLLCWSVKYYLHAWVAYIQSSARCSECELLGLSLPWQPYVIHMCVFVLYHVILYNIDECKWTDCQLYPSSDILLSLTFPSWLNEGGKEDRECCTSVFCRDQKTSLCKEKIIIIIISL